MTRPAVDPATLTGASPALTSLWHGGVRYLVNATLFEPELSTPVFSDKTEALRFALRLTAAAGEAQDRLMVLTGQHRARPRIGE